MLNKRCYLDPFNLMSIYVFMYLSTYLCGDVQFKLSVNEKMTIYVYIYIKC